MHTIVTRASTRANDAAASARATVRRARGVMSANGGALGGMVHARVHVLTNDGRHVVGTLRGFDQVTNVILEDCAERVYSSESGVEEAPLGVYMIRGDNVCVGDDAIDATRRRTGWARD